MLLTRVLIPLLEKYLQKDFVTHINTINKLAAFVLYLYYNSSLPSEQDHLIMLTAQTNVSDL